MKLFLALIFGLVLWPTFLEACPTCLDKLELQGATTELPGPQVVEVNVQAAVDPTVLQTVYEGNKQTATAAILRTMQKGLELIPGLKSQDKLKITLEPKVIFTKDKYYAHNNIAGAKDLG